MIDSSVSNYIDLRGTPCPLNFVRCSLAIESLPLKEILKVDIDKGEPEETVICGLRNAGHLVQVADTKDEYLTLLIKKFED